MYPELRRIAGRYLRRERVGHTLQPTALVHEAYVKLTIEETGEVLGLSRATVKRQWVVARAWLLANLEAGARS